MINMWFAKILPCQTVNIVCLQLLIGLVIMVGLSVSSHAISANAEINEIHKVAPIVPGEWRAVKKMKRIILYYELRKAVEASHLEIEFNIDDVRERDLSFYSQGKALLYELPVTIDSVLEKDFSLKLDGTLSFLWLNGKVWILDGHSLAREELNKSLGLTIQSDQNAYEYVRFFVNTLASEKDDFRFVNDPNEIVFDYKTDNLQPYSKEDEALIRGFYTKPAVSKINEQTWHVSSTILYKRVLFYDTFKVTTNGAVEIVKEMPLTRELPFEQVIWEAGVRLSSSDRAWRYRALKLTRKYIEEKKAEQVKLKKDKAQLEEQKIELEHQINKQKKLIKDYEELESALLVIGGNDAEITVHAYVNYISIYDSAIFTNESVCKNRHKYNKEHGYPGTIYGSELFCGRYWKIKREYIDSGRIKLVVHEFIFSDKKRHLYPAIVARCIPTEKVANYFFNFMNNFNYIYSDKEWPKNLIYIVKKVDSNFDLKGCVESKENEVFNNLRLKAQRVTRDFGINSVPSFRINSGSNIFNLEELIQTLSNYDFE